MAIQERLKKINAQKQIEKLAKKYKNKKVVLYGAGKFFCEVKENYDLSNLNILAVSDKKFGDIKEPVFDEQTGYNVISPLYLHTLKPDIVLLCVMYDFYVEKYFCEELFKTTKKKFKYAPLFALTLGQKIMREWENY